MAKKTKRSELQPGRKSVIFAVLNRRVLSSSWFEAISMPQRSIWLEFDSDSWPGLKIENLK